jgi:tRNA threonylcarbamoyladenosine biosynthesis protein TsaB
MLLLALDTCDARGSVAVLRADEILGVVTHDTSEDYSVWLLPAINRILSDLSVAFDDMDDYVAPTVPRSFTGVGVGLYHATP